MASNLYSGRRRGRFNPALCHAPPQPRLMTGPDPGFVLRIAIQFHQARPPAAGFLRRTLFWIRHDAATGYWIGENRFQPPDWYAELRPVHLPHHYRVLVSISDPLPYSLVYYFNNFYISRLEPFDSGRNHVTNVLAGWNSHARVTT